MGTISKQQAQPPLVLTLDVGSSSLRGSLYDSQGHALDGLEIKSTYQLDTTPDGGVEKDPDELFGIVCRAIDDLLERAGELAGQIAAVGVDTFWHSLMGIDRADNPTTPLLTWADTRSAATARQLGREVDERAAHARTGCKLHPTYFPAKLRWLASTQPVVFRRTVRWISFGEYFYFKIFGHTMCSLSMASGTGLLDQNRRAWDPEMLSLSRVSSDMLSPLGDVSLPSRGLLDEYARRWPTLAEVAWFQPVGDGAAGNLGSGCFSTDRIAVMIGTSGAMRVVCPTNETLKIPWGLWCYHADYRRFVVGGALSEGGNFFAWARHNFQLPSIEESEHELSMMEPDGHGLTVLPFLTGERSPGWNASARAALVGLSLDTAPIDILRAGLEAIAFRFGLLHEIMAATLPAASQIIASGGALLNSPTWMQILADVLNRPVIASAEGETTSRGVALLALESLQQARRPTEVRPTRNGNEVEAGPDNATPGKGDNSDILAQPRPTGGFSLDRAEFGFGQTYEPHPARHERYREAMERQKALYNVLVRPEEI